MADTPPDVPSGWVTLLATVFGTVAVSQVWRPLAAWVGRRLDLTAQGHASELSTCRKEIEALREQFEAHRAQSERTIRELSVEVAQLRTRLEEREADIEEYRRRFGGTP